jgi:lysyl-tRNA synthetase class 2
MNDTHESQPPKPLAELMAVKQQKVKELRERGLDPYPHRFKKTHDAAAIKDEAKTPMDTQVVVAGRLVQIREMGKASFAHILDGSAKLQLYVKKDLIGPEAYDFFKKDLHLGDFVGVEGKVFKTKTGEITVEAAKITLLSKALRPPPEKFHGLQDAELRHRYRHMDLISSQEVREGFAKRTRLIRAVRTTLDSHSFLEVETPVLLAQAGGAAATPFETFHRALGQPLFMRIATELYLKRLIIGGFERVYEIGRIFRNEGIDTSHNPEFTMLEAYQAYADYHDMASLAEAVFDAICAELGVEEVEYKGKKVRLKPPFKRVYLPEIWKEKVGEDIHNILDGLDFNRPALQALAKKLHIEGAADAPSAKLFERIFDEKIMPELWDPTFVMDHPTAITPLAKLKPGDTSIVERFELFGAGMELANAYTELNDPEDQRARLKAQMRQKTQEKAEADILDEDFVEALEVGMPPTGGIGMGIDRLAMLFTGNTSIREVILFPTLRTEQKGAELTDGAEKKK